MTALIFVSDQGRLQMVQALLDANVNKEAKNNVSTL